MGSFDRGFQLGNSIYNQVLDRRRQAEMDQRTQALHEVQLQGAKLGIQRTQQELDAGARAAQQAEELAGLRQQLNGAPAVDMAGPVNPDLPEGAAGRQAAGLYKPAMPAATGAKRYGLMSQMAALQGQYGMAADLDTRGNEIRIGDAVAGHTKTWMEMPEEQKTPLRLQFYSSYMVPLSIEAIDKDGLKVLTRTGKRMTLTPQDEATLYAAAQLMREEGPGNYAAGLKLLNSSGDRLRAIAKELLAEEKGLADSYNDAVFKKSGMENDLARTELARQQVGIASRTLGLKEKEFNEQFKRMDPKDIAALNDLSFQIASEQDPAKRVQLERAYARQYGIAATRIGKVVTPPSTKDRDTTPKVNADGSVTRDGELYVPDPKIPGKYRKADGFGPSALEKAMAAEEGKGTGLAVPAQREVPGRPMYYKTTAELEKLAQRPRGVSPAEAGEALRELAARENEPRMQGY